MPASRSWRVSGAADSTLALVGASGFLGQAVARELAARGAPARLVGRSHDAGAASAGVSLAQALTGCTVVINCAGRAHVSGEESPELARSRFFAVNCELAEELAEAARQAGAARFVHVSSVAALASTSTPDIVIGDMAAPAPSNLYGESKLAGDQRVLALATDGFHPVVLRPPAIYGAGAKGWFPAFLRAARAGVPLPLGSIANSRSFAYVGNIASAIGHAASCKETGAWIVTDSPPMSTADFYGLALDAAGHSRRVFPFPPAMLTPLIRLALGERTESLIGDAAFDGSGFIEQSGWHPPWTPAEAMRQTMDPGTSHQTDEHPFD